MARGPRRRWRTWSRRGSAEERVDRKGIAMLGLTALVAVAGLVRATGHDAVPAAAPTPAGAARPAPARLPTTYGVNIHWLPWFTHGRAFSNLLAGGEHWRSDASGWPAFDPARVDRNGTVLSLLPGEHAVLPMSIPQGAHGGAPRIRCTWDGKGEVEAHGAKDGSQKGQVFDFTWAGDPMIGFKIMATDPANPVRNIDCRERDADKSARFDPRFIAMLKPYKVVRFQGWQMVNYRETSGKWADRTLPTNPIASSPNGASVEDMVALANKAGVDPWFTMPWKADADYMANFARYVHEHLDPKRTVYVEIGNEVWNWEFPNAHWSRDEGQAEKLDPDVNIARMRRYAELAIGNFKIWQREWGADKGRIVRVLGGQAVYPDFLRLALDWKDVPKQIDAIAMAPYFGFDFFDQPRDTADTDALFRDLTGKVDEAIGYMRQDKALADRYGLRLIAYEAGQHLRYNGPDQTVIARLARDPRMETLYIRYIEGWKREAGDLLTFFVDVDPAGPVTDWGMSEWPGQPLAETPKVRALLAAQATGN